MRTLLLALLLTGLAAAAQAADCPYNANAAGLAEGQSLRCLCGPVAPGSTIYGTDRYTGDSGLCTAAVHVGVIDADGGEVAFLVGPGCKQFVASERNGIASKAYGSYGPTFGFTDPLPPCPEESAQASTAERLTKECLARGASADHCACENKVLLEHLGPDVAALLHRINDALAAGNKIAKLGEEIERLLTEVGLGLSILPDLKQQVVEAQAKVAEACPQ